jgi:hypothetical protein
LRGGLAWAAPVSTQAVRSACKLLTTTSGMAMVIGTACVMQMGGALAQAGAACPPGGTVAEVNACAVQDFQRQTPPSRSCTKT